MQLQEFERLVHRLTGEIPAEFLEGIADISISPRAVPHPGQEGVWTLGECIPLPTTDPDPRTFHSRIVLYFGSFRALAEDAGKFDWEEETWETLTHEVRHHVEWKARVPDLEAFDLAAEANFARQAGHPFDPLFYRDGVPRPDGSYQVDDDIFVERLVSTVPSSLELRWAGVDYRIAPPAGASLPAFLQVEGVPHAPPGELVLVLRHRTRIRDAFRRVPVFVAMVEATAMPVYLPDSESP